MTETDKALSTRPFSLNSLPHNDFLKTLWEKEKMLVTSIFSFSHNDFNPVKDKKYHLSYFYFVVCKCFQFRQVYIFVVWKSVDSTKRQILDSSKLKEFADDNFNFEKKGRIFFKWQENIVGKREIARYKRLVQQTVNKTRACLEKG